MSQKLFEKVSSKLRKSDITHTQDIKNRDQIRRGMLQQAIPQQKSTSLLGLVPANFSHPFSRPGQNER